MSMRACMSDSPRALTISPAEVSSKSSWVSGSWYFKVRATLRLRSLKLWSWARLCFKKRLVLRKLEILLCYKRILLIWDWWGFIFLFLNKERLSGSVYEVLFDIFRELDFVFIVSFFLSLNVLNYDVVLFASDFPYESLAGSYDSAKGELPSLLVKCGFIAKYGV